MDMGEFVCSLQAASAFKGLGKSITAIDITYSSKAEDQWVVATTDNELPAGGAQEVLDRVRR